MTDGDELCKLASPKRPSLASLTRPSLSTPTRPSSLQLSSTTVSQSWATPTSVLPTEKPITLAQKTLAQQMIINKNCRVIASYCRRDESPIASLEKIWDRKSVTDDEDSIRTASPKRRSFAGLTLIGRSENNLVKAFWKKRFFCIRRRSVQADNCFSKVSATAILEER